MSNLDAAISAEVERFVNAVKGLLADAVNALNAPTSPQTVEEELPSAGTDPGPVTVPDPTPPPAPEPVAPAPDGVVVSPGGDAQTAPDPEAPLPVEENAGQ